MPNFTPINMKKENFINFTPINMKKENFTTITRKLKLNGPKKPITTINAMTNTNTIKKTTTTTVKKDWSMVKRINFVFSGKSPAAAKLEYMNNQKWGMVSQINITFRGKLSPTTTNTSKYNEPFHTKYTSEIKEEYHSRMTPTLETIPEDEEDMMDIVATPATHEIHIKTELQTPSCDLTEDTPYAPPSHFFTPDVLPSHTPQASHDAWTDPVMRGFLKRHDTPHSIRAHESFHESGLFAVYEGDGSKRVLSMEESRMHLKVEIERRMIEKGL